MPGSHKMHICIAMGETPRLYHRNQKAKGRGLQPLGVGSQVLPRLRSVYTCVEHLGVSDARIESTRMEQMMPPMASLASDATTTPSQNRVTSQMSVEPEKK